MLSGTPSVVRHRRGAGGRTPDRRGRHRGDPRQVEALTAYAIALLDEAGLEIATPRDPALRGSHVTVRHPDARRITDQMIARGVVPDFREPDLIRLGLSPLSTSFAEVEAGVRRPGRRWPPPRADRLDGMTRVAVLGAKGRMGSESVRALNDAEGIEVVAQVDVDDSARPDRRVRRRGRARLHPARRPRSTTSPGASSTASTSSSAPLASTMPRSTAYARCSATRRRSAS